VECVVCGVWCVVCGVWCGRGARLLPGCAITATAGLMPVSLRVLLLSALAWAAQACTTDLSCSLNGKCLASACVCAPGWHGTECELLSLGPAPPGGAYGYDPNISAWGAHVVRVPGDARYHMFASEFWGDCGVHESWQVDSHVVHATSASPLGPYVYADTALPPEATCMHIAMNGSTIVMYHQGRSGNGHSTLKNCTGGSPYVPPRVEDWHPVTPHKVHSSDSPSGPWRAGGGMMPPGINCENPSPLLLPNGSTAVFCHGPGIRMWVSPGPAGTDGGDSGGSNNPVRFILQPGASPVPHTVWEDPTVYLDAQGHWHLLSHVYPTNVSNDWLHYADIVAGHAFSVDGVDWTFHPRPPWSADVTGVDGTTKHYATRERPFLLLSESKAPVRYMCCLSAWMW
jgi:hypothetical protein